MKLTRKITDILASMLISFMLSASITLSFMEALSLDIFLGRILLTCAAGAGWCALLTGGKFTRLAAILLGGGAVFCLVRFADAGEHALSLFRTLAALIAGGEGSLQQCQTALGIILSLLFSLIGFGLSRLQGGVYPAMTLAAIMMLLGWQMSHRLVVWYVAPGMAALIMMFSNARDSRAGYWKPLPLAAIITALALLLTPMNGPTWKPLEQAADKVRQMFEDYFLFTDPRTAYSIAADGYQPLGEALGGPASPREGTVMSVQTETDTALLLRGSVRRTYTGHAWSDSAVNNRYLYLDPTQYNTRAEIFNIQKNDGMPVAETSVSVTFTADGISTLFVPARMTELDLPIDIAAYYNDVGEVFIPRSVIKGDQYAFTSFEPEYGPALREHLMRIAGQGDESYDQAREDYLDLPNGISSRVYEMTRSIVSGCETPYDMALALRSYLLQNYQYETQVDYPPRDRDFVSWFLLDGGEGYCTYFASAMTVMARICGLPARYVEGYLVYPEPDGETEVTGEDAHAWVEIYFDGAGWISFDPTPGFEWTLPDGRSEKPAPTPTPDPAEGDDFEGAGDEPTPEPSPEPTPHDGEAPQEEPTPQPEDGEEPEPTPTPQPDPPPESEATPPPEDEPPQSDEDWSFPWWLLIMLLLAGMAGGVYWRIRSTEPDQLVKKQSDLDSRLMVWYRSLLGMLAVCGYGMEMGESPAAHGERLSGIAPWSGEYAAFVDALCRCRYGGQKADASVFRLAEAAYRTIYNGMTRRQKWIWITRRAIKGLGDLRNVPN